MSYPMTVQKGRTSVEIIDVGTVHFVYRVTTSRDGQDIRLAWKPTSGWTGVNEVADMTERALDSRFSYVEEYPDGTTALLLDDELAGEDSFCLVMHRTPERYLHERAALITQQQPETRVEVRHVSVEELWTLWASHDAARERAYLGDR